MQLKMQLKMQGMATWVRLSVTVTNDGGVGGVGTGNGWAMVMAVKMAVKV